MKNCSLPLLTFLLATFLASIAIAPSSRAAEKWLRLSSEHFDMMSCASERASKNMLVELEQFRAVFLDYFPTAPAYDKRLMIFVFDTAAQFQRYGPLGQDGKPRDNIAGVFLSSPMQPRFAMSGEDIDYAFGVLFHEYTHALLSARFGDAIPIWFNEGAAEFFSAFQVNGDTAEVGDTLEYHLRLLNHTPMIPIGTLVTVTGGSPYYNESDKMNIFYAQSWLALHYLICGAKTGASITHANLVNYLRMSANRKIPPDETLKKCLGFDYNSLGDTLNDYLRSGKFTRATTKEPAQPHLAKITSRPATDMERDAELAGLLARMRGTDVTPQLNQLAEKYPDNPRPRELLAERSSDRKETAAQCLKAIELGSANPLVYLQYLRNDTAATETSPQYLMPDDVCASYRAKADRLIELAPDCMEAYEMLAAIEAHARDIRQPVMLKVFAMLPRMNTEKYNTMFSIATMCWRLKEYTKAEEYLDALLADPATRHPNPVTRRPLAGNAQRLLMIVLKAEGKPLPTPPSKSSPSSKTKVKSQNPKLLAPDQQ